MTVQSVFYALKDNIMEPLIFPGSETGYRSELDLFSNFHTDIGVSNCSYEKIYPLNDINTPNASLQFEYHNNNTAQYVDLANSYMYVSGKVMKAADGAAITATNVSLSNNFLHSLFEDCKVQFNNVTVSNSENQYPYISYNKTLLENSGATKATELTSEMFYPDLKPDTGDATNSGWKSRQTLIAASSLVEMVGNLKSDVFSVTRYLPSGINIKIKMVKSNPAFHFWVTDGTDEYVFKFQECFLVLKKIQINPTILAKHEALWKKGEKVRIPFKSTELKSFTIPAGTFNYHSDNLFGGKLPERIFVSFVKADAYTGSYTKNPFNYEHFKLESVSTVIEEMNNYGETIEVNFAEKKFLEGFRSLFSMTNSSEDGNGLTRELFAADGHVILAFNILCPPDQNSFVPMKKGQLRIQTKFRTALEKAVTILVTGVTTKVLEIDADRNVTVLG